MTILNSERTNGMAILLIWQKVPLKIRTSQNTKISVKSQGLSAVVAARGKGRAAFICQMNQARQRNHHDAS